VKHKKAARMLLTIRDPAFQIIVDIRAQQHTVIQYDWDKKQLYSGGYAGLQLFCVGYKSK